MKNPWMSMWLSAANKAAGTARGFGTAELHRQQNTMAKKAARAMGLGPSSSKMRPAAKRRRKAAS